jgi:adenylate cyclase
MTEEDKIREAKRIYHRKKREKNREKQKEYERNFYLRKFYQYKQEGEL